MTPKPVTQEDINQLVEDYRQAAINAIEAGFDGIELHGANGYLIDQFLHHTCNQRDDEFGGSIENMARFPLMVIDAVIEAIGNERTALRLSPGAYFKMEPDNRDKHVFDYFIKQLNIRNLCYLHVGIFDDSMRFDYLEGTVGEYIRTHYDKTLIGVGGLTPETASEAIKTGKYDLIAIGRPLIANPDYVQRVKMGIPLIKYDDSMLLKLI
jgi:2,4-dienoyl-CoA reductase-like NADH-dependent reductase (Old Yellow Enzyme family)